MEMAQRFPQWPDSWHRQEARRCPWHKTSLDTAGKEDAVMLWGREQRLRLLAPLPASVFFLAGWEDRTPRAVKNKNFKLKKKCDQGGNKTALDFILGMWTQLPKSSPYNSDLSGHCLSFAMKFKALNKSIKSVTLCKSREKLFKTW